MTRPRYVAGWRGRYRTYVDAPSREDWGGSIGVAYTWPGLGAHLQATRGKRLQDRQQNYPPVNGALICARELHSSDALALEVIDVEMEHHRDKLRALEAEKQGICERAITRGKRVKVER
jgi:hypothetical protein